MRGLIRSVSEPTKNNFVEVVVAVPETEVNTIRDWIDEDAVVTLKKYI